MRPALAPVLLVILLAVIFWAATRKTTIGTTRNRPDRKERKATAKRNRHWQKTIDDAENHLAMSMAYTTGSGLTIAPENLHQWILFHTVQNTALVHHADLCFECVSLMFGETVSEKTPAPVPEKTPEKNPENSSEKNAGASSEKTSEKKRPPENAENPWMALQDTVEGKWDTGNPENPPPVSLDDTWEATWGKLRDHVRENPRHKTTRYAPGGTIPTFTSNYVFKTPDPETCPLCTATSQDLPAHMRDYHPSAMGWTPEKRAADREARTQTVWEQIINGPQDTTTSGNHCLVTKAHAPHGYCAGVSALHTGQNLTAYEQSWCGFIGGHDAHGRCPGVSKPADTVRKLGRCGGHDVHGPHRATTWRGETIWCEGFTGVTASNNVKRCPLTFSGTHSRHRWITHDNKTLWCEGDAAR